MYTFEQTRAGYLTMWTRAKLLDSKRPAALAIARKMADAAHRPAFQAVQTLTGVPWYVVGCLLERESSLDLGTYLGNGEKLSRVTTLVPAGRGPFTGPTAFLDGAVDALKHEGMTGITDWSVERILYWCERFNGQGYFGKGNSPYIWSWTDQYSGGKFTSDHGYDPHHWDEQPGVAALLKALAEIYPDIAQALTRAAPMPSPSPVPQPPSASVPQPPETTPMPTPTTVALPPSIQIPHIDFATIEKLIESFSFVIPIIAAFVPQAKIIVPFIPVLEQLLKAADEVQRTSAGGGDIFAVIAKHLHTVADQVKAAPAIAAASPPTSSAGMPNS